MRGSSLECWERECPGEVGGSKLECLERECPGEVGASKLECWESVLENWEGLDSRDGSQNKWEGLDLSAWEKWEGLLSCVEKTRVGSVVLWPICSRGYCV